MRYSYPKIIFVNFCLVDVAIAYVECDIHKNSVYDVCDTLLYVAYTICDILIFLKNIF